jgi:hypothetical protein
MKISSIASRTGMAGVLAVAVYLAPAARAFDTSEPVGPPAVTQMQTPTSCGRLRVHGTDIVCHDGTRFTWRGVTAFGLLEQIAHGRRADADAYLRWARGTGFNLVRVLAMADVLFKLSPEEGRAHLATLFGMAAERGLYVEIVALADTARVGMTAAMLREQVTAVSHAASRHPTVVV